MPQTGTTNPPDHLFKSRRSLEYSPGSIDEQELQLVQGASNVKTSNDIWNDVHCDLVRELEKKGIITRYNVRHLKLWIDLIVKGKSAGVGNEPNWEEFIDIIGVPPKKRRETFILQNQTNTEVFQTSLLAILANQQVHVKH